MSLFTGREWSELGSRDIDGKAERPRERARTSQWIASLGIYDYRHRMYHPGLGRFLQTDPMGLQTEGAKLTPEQKALYGAGAPEALASSEMNLYRYCGDDPMDRSDPTGLETAVSIGMGTDDNPLGHIAFATSSQGTLSVGTHTPPSSNFTTFLSNQATYRNTMVYVLHTTQTQEAKIRNGLVTEKQRALPDARTDKLKALGDNCSTRTADALRAGGIQLLGDTHLPAQLQHAMQDMAKRGEASVFSVPKDSHPSEAWKLFDKKPGQ